MAVNAPLVKYYEDVLNDGQPTGDVKEITLWDAGIRQGLPNSIGTAVTIFRQFRGCGKIFKTVDTKEENYFF